MRQTHNFNKSLMSEVNNYYLMYLICLSKMVRIDR